MPVGRPRTKPLPEPSVQINEELLAKDMANMRAMSQIETSYTADRDTLNQLIGRVQMGRAIGGFTEVMSLQTLKTIKESKSYKSLAGKKGEDRNGIPIPDLGTWDGFCRALGFSPDKLDEDLKNLDAFGEEALENLAAIGAGYRDLRQYRKLPEDKRQALIEVAKVGDKEGFVELAEQIFAKHEKEKDTLLKATEEARLDLAASEKRIGVLRQQREQAEVADARFAALSPEGRLTKLQDAATQTMRSVSVTILQLKVAMLEVQQADAHAAPFLAGLLKRISLELGEVETELHLPAVSDVSASALAWLKFQEDEERSKTAPE